MDDLSIREVIDHILGGRIRVPAFQRGFVWDPDRVAFLMDSLFKGYPIGTILMWRTRNELETERELGPFELQAGDVDDSDSDSAVRLRCQWRFAGRPVRRANRENGVPSPPASRHECSLWRKKSTRVARHNCAAQRP